jgi:hypothetical protein
LELWGMSVLLFMTFLIWDWKDFVGLFIEVWKLFFFFV